MNVGLRTEAMLAQLIQKICLGMGVTKAGKQPFTVADFFIHGSKAGEVQQDIEDGEIEDDEEEEGIKFGDAVRAIRGITKGQ